MKRIAMIGTGGFALQVSSFLERDERKIIYYGDSAGGSFRGQIIQSIDHIRDDDLLAIAIGNSKVRQKICQSLNRRGDTLQASTALVSEAASVDDGAIICDFAVIEAAAQIGRQFHANVYSFIAHEARIGDFVTFAPRATCNGAVEIGDHVYVGANAVIRQGVKIGEGAVIGMGAVVTKDVPPNVIVVGNPARCLPG